MMNIPFASFVPMHEEIRQGLDAAFKKVVDKSYFIQGEECEKFEEEYAAYCGTKYCVGVATGLDAIYLILKALDIKAGDEVIVPSNTYIATALAVSFTGAKPLLRLMAQDTKAKGLEHCLMRQHGVFIQAKTLVR